eukprot:TRINITY_DN23447_c0_g1_i1.p1 TRINITY_DN23447_c0_g1~~TRINITY_DN23447_c0_g1_i1.p1  ORF type:complete len:518 (+),score=80.34 TRINITY_DN23447_c0_g1_i1:113-1666(+)
MRGFQRRRVDQQQQHNVMDELRATADRRKKTDDATSSQLRGEGIKQMASRLAQMFPALPVDTVEAVLSEHFRADARITRETLADRAVTSLVEMSLADGSPQVITSFEPPALDESDRIPEPSAPPMDEIERFSVPDETSGAISTEIITQGDFDLDDMLYDHLALLLTLPDDTLSPCVQTLKSILDRIVDDPGNARVRRLRHGSKTWAAKIGCHEAAVNLLRLAGFEDDPGDNEDDRGLVFCGDCSQSSPFGRVREALHGIVNDLETAKQPSTAAPATRQHECGRITAQEDKRRRIAKLTEERLRNPTQFRQQALDRGSANKATGGHYVKQALIQDNSTSHRHSRHFTLSDIERMRVHDEIANTTNYADEYIRARQSAPAHDYSTLVARSYDPELISRQALDGTNSYRASKGLAPCRWNEGIAQIAAEHAASMASGASPFSHDGFNSRVARFPVAQRGAGENLALSSGVANVAETAVKGWIQSPGHEKNLRGNWNVCGIGTACSANGTFYTTQLFALCL